MYAKKMQRETHHDEFSEPLPDFMILEICISEEQRGHNLNLEHQKTKISDILFHMCTKEIFLYAYWNFSVAKFNIVPKENASTYII
jgi:hypothetical protein